MKLHLIFNINYIIVAGVLIALTLFSCTKKEESKDDKKDAGGIYAIYSYGTQHRNRKAMLWKDGVETDLTTYLNFANNTTSSKLYMGDVAVSPSGDVYVSGCECRGGLNIYNHLNDSCYTVLWKNGIKQDLNAAFGSFWFLEYDDNHMRINESGDVFVIGLTGKYGNHTLWKNGIISIQMKDVDDVLDMYVKGNDVFVVGLDTSNRDAQLWKNGKIQPLSASDTYARTVLVASNNDVYVGLGNGKLLKNNREQSLEAPLGNELGEIVDIFEANGDIFVLGSRGSTYPYTSVIWKNGKQLYELNYNKADDGIDPETLFVYGFDVYAYGHVTYNSNKAANTSSQDVVIWKNGEVFKTIAVLENIYGIMYAPSIFVK